MEAVGQLTGGIAHDFNNLLNVISGNVELIERYSGDDRVKRMAKTARGRRRGAKLTGQLLAFRASQEPVDLAHLMGEVRDLLSAAMGPEIRLEFGRRAGPAAGHGRPEPDRAGDPEPGHQRP